MKHKEKIKKRKALHELRKAKAELSMLLSYLDDCKDLMSDYSAEWTSDINFIIDRLNKSPDAEEDSSDKNEDNQEAEKQEVSDSNFQNFEFEDAKEKPEFEDVVKPNTPDWAKKAFRKIALKTHPDKAEGSENFEELQELYAQANRAVEEENYDLLLEICGKLSIENSLDPEMELQYNSKRQDLVREELDKLTSTLPWVWGESCDEIQIRKSLLITILPKYGFQDVTEEEISEVLEALSQA